MEIDKGSTRYRNVLVHMKDGTMITGKINIQMTNRVSDFINNEKTFVVVVVNNSNVKIINKEFITMVEPEGENS
jgi:hypothetical protein